MKVKQVLLQQIACGINLTPPLNPCQAKGAAGQITLHTLNKLSTKWGSEELNEVLFQNNRGGYEGSGGGNTRRPLSWIGASNAQPSLTGAPSGQRWYATWVLHGTPRRGP